ncbi:uncharacterized protein [Argopecten irradians]|uniref:uncharacterized protein n=1 Tax=Argopecten irradians TaxID=31199 RepID=UPI00371A7C65
MAKSSRQSVQAIKWKHRSWQRYLETREMRKYNEYVKARNKVKTLVRKFKKCLEKDIAKDVKTNPKKFWRYANSKTKSKSGITELHIKCGKELTIAHSDQDKANALADYFSSVFTVEPQDDIPVLKKLSIENPFINTDISELEVLNILKSLNPTKSPGADNIHPKVLKETADILKTPLCEIFNWSLKTGELPQYLEGSPITAIHKKGDKKNAGNYRPWTEVIDQGGSIQTIYLDFMKAFDTVPHLRLIGKLKSYGLSPEIIKWVESFLTNRKQQVSVNGELSK